MPRNDGDKDALGIRAIPFLRYEKRLSGKPDLKGTPQKTSRYNFSFLKITRSDGRISQH